MHVFAQRSEPFGFEHPFEGRHDVGKAAERFAQFVFGHPGGVEPFLRQRPRIVFDDDRKAHFDRFAHAAGAGFADEEIGELHELRDLFCEAFDVLADASGALAELIGEPDVFPAKEEELDAQGGAIDAVVKIEHLLRSFPAEQDQPGGHSGL